MKKLTVAGIIFVSIVLVIECKKVDNIPARPNITFTSFQTLDYTDTLGNPDRAGKLKFHFEDGDGDLGLQTPTSPDMDSVNLFFKLYRVKNGVLVPAADNDPLKPSDYRIPYMTKIGQNPSMSGTITVTFYYLFYDNSDTIKYTFYVKDRAGNISDTASTCEIPIIKDTICTGN